MTNSQVILFSFIVIFALGWMKLGNAFFLFNNRPRYVMGPNGCPINAICLFGHPNNKQCGPALACPTGLTCCAGGLSSCCMDLPNTGSVTTISTSTTTTTTTLTPTSASTVTTPTAVTTPTSNTETTQSTSAATTAATTESAATTVPTTTAAAPST